MKITATINRFVDKQDSSVKAYVVLSISLDTFYSNKNYAARKI